jgi:hypothetical protein
MEAWLSAKRFSSVRLSRRQVGTALLSGAILSTLLLAPSRLSAAIPTIELSPLVAKSILVAPLDTNKQISVVFAEVILCITSI